MAALRPLKVRWARRARLHLAGIEEFIGPRNSKAAERIGAAIRSAVRLLQDFPNAGRPGRAAGTREWVVRGLPYIIVYEVLADGNELHVLGVFHGAQQRPDDWAKIMPNGRLHAFRVGG